MDNRIIIIDGNSLINRAYYAMKNPMITRDGIYTQGIFGFLNMLNKVMKDYESGYMVITFDRKAPTFRHLEYDEYKAGRKKMPPELVMQLPLLKDILEAMNIKMIEMDGFEADDLIGTIARRSEENGLVPLIITGDKDELQLATDTTKVMITRKGVSEFDIYDYQAMVDKYGFTPTQFIDFKGLMGDASDNIPGVPGVGEKTASKLICEYGSVENVINNIEQMPANKLREKLENNKELAIMSKRLATINVNVPVDIDFTEYRIDKPDYSKLLGIYQKLELNTFIKRLQSESLDIAEDITENIEVPQFEMTDINDVEQLRSAVGEAGNEIFIQVLSDNNHKSTPIIYGIGFIGVSGVGNGWYIDGASGMVEALTAELNKQDIRLCGHDLKQSIYALMCYGLQKVCCSFDIVIAQYLLDSAGSSYDIDILALERLHMEIISRKDLDKKTSQIGMFDDNSKVFKNYVHSVLKASMALRRMLEPELVETNMKKVFTEIEMPLIEVLAAMEYDGIAADSRILNTIGEEISSEIKTLEQGIYDKAGREFNINSPQQLGIVLFEEMGLPAGKKTKRGYSTSADILEKLKDDNPIVAEILNYRMLSKLNSTYIAGLIPLISEDGRIHAHFQQTVAATGRLSCTEPNLQNIPIRHEYGRQIRKAFVCTSDEYLFVGADYSQIELRVLAALSKDPELIDAFNRGEDIHKLTAARVLGIPADEITFEQRSAAKAVNFGVIYGMSGFGLSTELNITRKEAERYIDEYFKKYSSVRTYMDEQIEFCRNNKYVVTISDRRRYIKEINASNFMTRQLGERLAMNSPIQGSAADIIKIAMINVYQRLKSEGLKARLILQIHDELIIETPHEEKDKVGLLLREEMENAVDLGVKFAAEVNEGRSWYDLK